MAEKWHVSYGPCHDWHWGFSLPNGWSAVVTDDSQMVAPKRPTRYYIGASSRMRYIGGDREYRDFYEAKQAALELAMAQEPNADAVL